MLISHRFFFESTQQKFQHKNYIEALCKIKHIDLAKKQHPACLEGRVTAQQKGRKNMWPLNDITVTEISKRLQDRSFYSKLIKILTSGIHLTSTFAISFFMDS